MTEPGKPGRPKKHKPVDVRLLQSLGVSLEEMQALSPEEQTYLMTCLEEMAESGTSATAASLMLADYKWQPVTMQQFIEDPYYMGSLTGNLFPLVKAFLIDLFDSGTETMYALYGGGIGTGKSLSASVIICYLLYRLTCLRDPHAFYGLTKGNKIFLAVYSLNLDQAMDGIYGKVLSWVDSIPYFAHKCPRVKRINSSIKFTDSPVEVIVASKLDHTIGKDILACIPEGTLVCTEHGLRPVESVREGDCVYTERGLRRCTGAVFMGEKPCVRIVRGDGDEDIAARTHRMLVSRGSVDEWVFAGDISAGDALVVFDAPMVRRTTTICAVNDAGCLPCWDITNVEETASYLTASGAVNHNCVIDEASFFRAANGMTGEDVAEAIYDSTQRRMTSRFMQDGGKVAGMIILASSKTTKTSFFEKKVKDLKDELKVGKAKLFSYAQWEVKPASLYVKPRFKVEIGDRVFPSRVLQDGEPPRPGAEVLNVPGEYKAEFLLDVDKALRDLAGVASEGMMPLFRDKQPILACIDPALQHPFSRQSITLDTRSDLNLDAYFRPEAMFKTIRSKYVLRLNPHAPRFVGMDLSLTGDCLGMAMCHISGFRTVERVRADGTTYEDRAPVVVYDFILQVLPPLGSEIDLAKPRAFILALRDYGVEIVRVTMDSSNSRDMVQIFRKLGFDCNISSVSKTDEAYLAFRQGVVEKRVHYYEYPPLIEELGRAERDIESRKVTHPRVKNTDANGVSHGDVADGAVQAYWTAINDKRTLLPEVNYRDMSALVSQDTHVSLPQGGNTLWSALDREAR